MRLFYSLFFLARCCSRGRCAAPRPADWIWSARYVVTMDAQHRVIENGAVAIVGDHIVGGRARARRSTGLISAKQRAGPAGCDSRAGADQHAHARGHVAVPRHRRRSESCRTGSRNSFSRPKPRTSTAEFVRWGTRLACLEMALSGTTTYTDMYYFEDTVAEATKEAGLRGVLGQTVIGFPAPDYKTPQRGAGRHGEVLQSIRQRSADRSGRRAARDLHQYSDEAAARPCGRWRIAIRSRW